MHELSIAHNIVEVATTAAHSAGAPRVNAVHLRLGALSGVVKEALHFGWEIATQDTLLAGATLEIEEVPVMIHCPTCRANVTLPSVQSLRCPVCQTPSGAIVQGREIEVKSLEIIDEHPSA